MGFQLVGRNLKPNVSVHERFSWLLQTSKRYENHFWKRCKCSVANIFSASGVWANDLNADILKEIDRYWNGHVQTTRPAIESTAKSVYVLAMFPYPSGKLHMGHVRVYTLSDTIARFYRMKGFNVIHPIGWDAFGLPAENAAFEKGAQPAEWTMKNIDVMRNQLLQLGFSFDWDREFATCSPHYYKWTQYLFLKLFHHGYAYRRQAVVNWDPVDQTVLADEQVDENGCSWRSGAKVEKKSLNQWFIRTSCFSKSLFDGLSDPILQRWKDVIFMQRNWIGECNGYIIDLCLIRDGHNLDDSVSVWLERPELLFGVAFICVRSDHFFNNDKKCSGGVLNVSAVHPLTKKAIPIYVNDTLDVVNSTSTRVGIPCFNSEDKCFADEQGLFFTNVVLQQPDGTETLCNSQEYSGLLCAEGRQLICAKLKDIGTTCYPASPILRDWLVSRQRYWGTPIPVVHCPNCGIVPVPFEKLPVVLPDIMVLSKKTISPLASANEWLKCKCPQCDGDARRETDTLDTFVDSSWYFLRYLDPKNKAVPFDPGRAADIMPVNLYIGGKEHAVLHLYYARFMSHFLHSLGFLKHPEPFSKLLVQGLVTAESYKLKTSGIYIQKEKVDFSGKTLFTKDTHEEVTVQWEKMSKSKYNGVEVNDMVNEYGVDLLRICMMAYYSPFSQRKWKLSEFTDLIKWKLKLWLTVKEFMQQKQGLYPAKTISVEEQEKYEQLLSDNRSKFIQRITFEMEVKNDLREVVNDLKTMSSSLRNTPLVMWGNSLQFERMLATMIIMASPIVPHFASELWAGFSSCAQDICDYDVKSPVLSQKWPEVSDYYLIDFVVNVNGKSTKTKIPFAESRELTATSALDKVLKMNEFNCVSKDQISSFHFNNEVPYSKIIIDLNMSA